MLAYHANMIDWNQSNIIKYLSQNEYLLYNIYIH